MKEELRHTIEPLFLSQALASGVKLRIGLMNKTEHEGVIRDIGRYEINIDQNGGMLTILKQEISYLSAPHPVHSISSPLSTHTEQPSSPGVISTARPNIQQEFLDKAIKENHVLTLFLINGQRIKATIQDYDNFTILIRESEKQSLYYKHSITTINR